MNLFNLEGEEGTYARLTTFLRRKAKQYILFGIYYILLRHHSFPSKFSTITVILSTARYT